MIFVYQSASTKRWIVVLGTMVQIMLPCYILVPVLWKKDTVGAWQMIRMMVIVLTITYVLKYAINAERPNGDGLSFPSGHTVGAFMGSMFLSVRYGLKYFLISTPFALFVAFTRLYTHKHWPIDIIAGITLCSLVALLYVKKI